MMVGSPGFHRLTSPNLFRLESHNPALVLNPHLERNIQKDVGHLVDACSACNGYFLHHVLSDFKSSLLKMFPSFSSSSSSSPKSVVKHSATSPSVMFSPVKDYTNKQKQKKEGHFGADQMHEN